MFALSSASPQVQPNDGRTATTHHSWRRPSGQSIVLTVVKGEHMRRAFSASLRSTTGPFLALGAAAALIGGALVVPPAVAASTVPDPVVHYTFESSDLTTGQVTDVSGNGATGTLVNPSTATIVPGADGSSALHLPGGSPSSNGAYVRLPTSILAGRTDLTVTARVNWDGTGGAWQRIVDLGDLVGGQGGGVHREVVHRARAARD